MASWLLSPSTVLQNWDFPAMFWQRVVNKEVACCIVELKWCGFSIVLLVPFPCGFMEFSPTRKRIKLALFSFRDKFACGLWIFSTLTWIMNHDLFDSGTLTSIFHNIMQCIMISDWLQPILGDGGDPSICRSRPHNKVFSPSYAHSQCYHQKTSNITGRQWPCQEPKLEVPTIYKAEK